MILDERGEFLDATALNTGAAGTYLIGDVIDTAPGPLTRDAGLADGLWFVVQVDTAATSGGAATLQLKLVSDAQAAIATDGSATEHLVTPVFALAAVSPAGKQLFAAKVPPGAYERYIGVLQVTGTAAFTGGKLNAFFTKDLAKWNAYPAPQQA